MATAQEGQVPQHDPNAEKTVDAAGEGHETHAVAPRLGFGNAAVATQGDVEQMPLPLTPPWMKIVHGVGKASKLGFAPGSLILGKEPDSVLIAKPKTENYNGDSLKIIVWAYDTFFKEYAYIEGQQAKRFKTAAEAHAAGFTTLRNAATGAMPTAPLAMTWLVLVEQPKDLMCERFLLEVGEKKYAPCFFEVDKKAFRAVYDNFNLMVFATKKTRGIKSVEWELRTRVVPGKGDGTWVPTIRKLRIIPDAELEQIVAATSQLAAPTGVEDGDPMAGGEAVERAPDQLSPEAASA
jgi:hypothetical protein